MLDHLERTMRRKLHTHAVATAIFCPACEDVLDVRRAVTFDLEGVTRVLCGECFDRIPEAKRETLTDVLDGRPKRKPLPLIGEKRRGLGTWGEARISTPDGDETVLAWIRPRGGFHLRPVRGNWFLTHVATGKVMFQTTSQAKALKAVRAAERIVEAGEPATTEAECLATFRPLHAALKAERVIL